MQHWVKDIESIHTNQKAQYRKSKKMGGTDLTKNPGFSQLLAKDY